MYDYQKRLFNEVYAPDRQKAAVDTFYHNWFGKFNRDRNTVVSSLIGEGGELLDLGCLDGDLIFRLGGRFGSFAGIDIVENRLERARQLAARRGVRGEFIMHDLNNGPLPFDDGRFDVVSGVGLLVYIYDIEGFLREIARVLKTGGKFVFQVPNAVYLPRRLSFLAGRLPRQVFDPGMAQAFNKDRCIELIRGAGLRVERITGSGLFPGLRSRWPALLTGDLIFETTKR